MPDFRFDDEPADPHAQRELDEPIGLVPVELDAPIPYALTEQVAP
jgi:hypothetical protein